VKATTIWISLLLLVFFSIALEILVKGWDRWQVGFGTPALLLLFFSPILIPAFLVSLPFCALIGRSIAHRKRRRPAEGFMLGLLLGPLGLLIEGALRNRTEGKASDMKFTDDRGLLDH
jgi:hypothetical protein